MKPEQVAFLSKFGALARDSKAQVFSRPEDVDPLNEHDWYSLQLGFGLDRGLSPEDAHEFARVLRYQFDDGGAVPDDPAATGRPTNKRGARP